MLARNIQNIKVLLAVSAILCVFQIVSALFGTAYAATQQIDRDARIIYYNNRPPNANGNFHFEFQTTNGITTKAAGNENGFSGVIQYVSSEGIPITMTYIADADGYHPSGEHIPTIPDYVFKSLDYIRTHPVVDEKQSRRL